MSSAPRPRALSLVSYAFIGLSAFVLAIGIFLYAGLGSVQKALPIRTVGQYRNLTGMMPLLSTLAAGLERLPQDRLEDFAGELRFTLNKINNSIRLIESVFDARVPPDLGSLITEISRLASDISASLASPESLTPTDAILLKNRAGYAYSEFRDYVFRVNDDSLIALGSQGLAIGKLKVAMPLALAIVLIAIVLTFAFLWRQRRLIAQLEESRALAMSYSEAKSRFLSKMTHEIRTPLNAILGYSQILLREKGLSAEARREIEVMNSSGEHLLSLVNEILETSKIEAGKVEVAEEDCGLRALLAQVEAMFVPAIRKKGIGLEVDLGAEAPEWIRTDEAKLRQTLINLVGNAIKFTDSGSVSLRVYVAPPAGKRTKLAFEVADTGPGIDAKDLSAIFEAFEQAEAGRDRGGTGLGLSISRHYARLLGGALRVQSRPGEGSRFTLEIALRPGREAARTPGAGARIRGIAAGRAPRTLIVDDGDTNRDILVRLLEPLGFPVAQASDGREALAAVASWKPELLLLDLIMPGMGGRELIRAIRADPSKAALRIIVITASALEDERRGVMALGVDAFVRKPFKEREVLEEIGLASGLVYDYEEASEDGTAALLGQGELERRLAALPPALRDLLGQALAIGDAAGALEAAGKIASLDPGLAGHIRFQAEDFEFGGLIATLRALRTEVP